MRKEDKGRAQADEFGLFWMKPSTKLVSKRPNLIQFPFLLLLLLFFFFKFLAALGLCCFAWAFSSCGEWGLLFISVCGLLTAVASLVAHRLSSCSSQARVQMGFSICGSQA